MPKASLAFYSNAPKATLTVLQLHRRLLFSVKATFFHQRLLMLILLKYVPEFIREHLFSLQFLILDVLLEKCKFALFI